jgi:hypothetical protein
MNLHDISHNPSTTRFWWSPQPHDCIMGYETSSTDHHPCADQALEGHTYYCECCNPSCYSRSAFRTIHYFNYLPEGRTTCPDCLAGNHPVPPAGLVSPTPNF